MKRNKRAANLLMVLAGSAQLLPALSFSPLLSTDYSFSRSTLCCRSPRPASVPSKLQNHPNCRKLAMGENMDKFQKQMAAVLASVVVATAPFQPACANADLVVTHAALVLHRTYRAPIKQLLYPVSRVVAQTATDRTAVPRSLAQVQPWRYSEFLAAVEQKKVLRVTFSPNCKRIVALTVDGRMYKLEEVPQDNTLYETLTEHNVDIIILENLKQDVQLVTLQATLFFSLFLFVNGLVLLWQGFTNGGAPSEPYRATNETRVTFEHVMGVDGAKEELQELVHFLKEPDKYTALGARIPRGVILQGPPGTGKTLLARAVAGEAGVPFFPMSGSEFVEMYVGMGAARVRGLFEEAKKVAPCIIFIDEIDAMGRKRNERGGGDERMNTLNQLLTEMDGFEGNPGVICLAATNRAEVLDEALVRPGRFDRKIMLDFPDYAARIAILGVHCKNKPLEGVELSEVARQTPGFSGASLANLMNEAAIFAARQNATAISRMHVADALERISFGPIKKSGHTSERRQRVAACHEAGHALVAALLPDCDQVSKITIAPRGNAGGMVVTLPCEHRLASGMYTRRYLESQIAVALGGRIAEELEFGENSVTTSASNDLQKATETATMMVRDFGMSDRLGQATYPRGASLSHETISLIDSEVADLVKLAYGRAKQILVDHRQSLTSLTAMLLEKETVTGEELQRLLVEGNMAIPYLREPEYEGYDA